MPSIMKLIKNPAKVFFILNRLGVCKLFPDKFYLKFKFRASLGKPLDLANPKTYNEKLQWLKLYDRNPMYPNMVDKLEVKQYIAEKIGHEYIVPTLGFWDSVDGIDFDALPEQFVLKCTHDSGGIVICKDKSQLDIGRVKKKLRKAMKRNFYDIGREWPYKNIKPRILAEPYLEDHVTGELRDYKFFCFDGVVKAMYVASERQEAGEDVKFDFFDMHFEHLNFRQGHPNSSKIIKKPENFEQMKVLAEALSLGLPHVRVDFYEVDGKIYFGELTFFHCEGFLPFEPEEWDYTFGSWLQLPQPNKELSP